MNLTAPADRLVTLPEGIPPLTLGFEAIKWASMYLRHPDGPHAGPAVVTSSSPRRVSSCTGTRCGRTAGGCTATA